MAGGEVLPRIPLENAYALSVANALRMNEARPVRTSGAPCAMLPWYELGNAIETENDNRFFDTIFVHTIKKRRMTWNRYRSSR